jgi:hypothetical protein
MTVSSHNTDILAASADQDRRQLAVSHEEQPCRPTALMTFRQLVRGAVLAAAEWEE